jgi:hypothetical protein
MPSILDWRTLDVSGYVLIALEYSNKSIVELQRGPPNSEAGSKTQAAFVDVGGVICKSAWYWELERARRLLLIAQISGSMPISI